VRVPRIVTFYRELPEPAPFEDAELWAAGFRSALVRFLRQVESNYTEATLERLLNSPDPVCRRAAVVALGLVGTTAVNAAVAARLHDSDPLVRQLASDALWAVWFRGQRPELGQELQRIVGKSDSRTMLRELDALVLRACDYAEAYNQRAILYYRLGEFRRSVTDCEATLRLNPHHFGAAAGMAQCYLKLNKPRAALRAFRTALEINPNLDDVEAAVRALEEALGEGAEDL
jgi:tetratricopeptide (TPR) repeat protein